MSRHFLDSLVAVPFLERLSPRVVADVGSGGGFPGIPLALYFPEIPFVLVERSGKRVRFLESVVSSLSARKCPGYPKSNRGVPGKL
jgi:16S rRNA (guanine527-N7)-methyltransferase